MPSKCPFGNAGCMCQTCSSKKLNNGRECVECHDCAWHSEAVHDIWFCTAYKQKDAEVSNNAE